jgi:hypothetical protein
VEADPERAVEEGLLFTRAYTPNAKCAPSHACLLTGRNSWQLERRLRGQQDPRMFGEGHRFEQEPYAQAGQRDSHRRFMSGEPARAGWVNASDFEPSWVEE